ncbi:hypothetical protein QM565_15215 [Geitlerinema splendidum]|nr:hypothetical protein [Geitlerinema splendidum]
MVTFALFMSNLADSEISSISLIRKLLPFLLSFLDDILLIGLSRLGCNLPWLQWLSPAIMVGTGIYFLVQFWQSPYGAAKARELWESFQQPEEALET